MTRFPKLSRRKLRLAIRITVSQADRGTKGGTGRCAGCSPSWHLPCRSGWPIPKSVLDRFRAVTPASCFGAENPGGAFGRSVGARLPCARHRGQPWSAISPAATDVVAHATLSLPQLNQPTETSTRDVASNKPRICVHFDGPSEPIVRFASRALKALRFAPPAQTRGCRS